MDTTAYEALKLKNTIGQLRKLVLQDDVTGLGNQRKLYRDLKNNFNKLKNGPIPFSLLFIDLDRFKLINDGMGHVSGSFLLRQFAQLLQLHLGKNANIYRYGGDEFVILMPFCGEDWAYIKAKKLIEQIKDHIFVNSHSKFIKLSASIGVAEAKKGQSPEDILEMADHLMYQAKKTGRGKAVKLA